MKNKNDRIPCKWCAMKGQCGPQCKYYSNTTDTSGEETSPPSKIQELAYELKVQDAMSRDLISVPPDATMNEVRKIFRDKRISGLPVVEQGALIGLISLERFITCIMNGGINEVVKDNMTKKVQSLYATDPLIHAVSQFETLGYGRFPILERDTEKLVGIITKGDVIECLLNKLHISYYEEEIHKYRASHIFEDITSDETTLILRHKVPGKAYRYAGKQCGRLKTSLSRLGISPQVIRRLTVAACEAEMNIIVFTDGGELSVYVEEDKIIVRAVDDGPGIPDIEKAMQPGYSTAPDWVREMGFGTGMGLPNIKSCADEMRLESAPGQGTNLEFVVFLK